MSIDKASVKSGGNSPEVITAVRCVNVGLFLSGDLRRDVVVSLAIGTPEDMMIISFPGADLKRVSPDERSISFFLLKAIEAAKVLETNTHRTMDNGIVVRRSSLFDFIDSCSPEKIYITNLESKSLEKFESAHALLIYPHIDALLLELEASKLVLRQLPQPSHPERFILDINMMSDEYDSVT